MKDTIRVLAIAPYEGLAHLLKLIGSQYDMLHLDIFVGDLDQGLTIANLPDSKGFRLEYDATRNVVLSTLQNCNGNQTKAAQRLGISRTTMWRYLK